MRRIFAFQARGNIPDAVRSADALEDRLLLGTLLADRYLGRRYRTTPDELTDWLTHYRDFPDAASIHALLLTRLPKGTEPPLAPDSVALERASETAPMPGDIDPPRNDLARNPMLDRSILDRARRSGSAPALRLITTTRGLSPAYAAQLRAEVAQGVIYP